MLVHQKPETRFCLRTIGGTRSPPPTLRLLFSCDPQGGNFPLRFPLFPNGSLSACLLRRSTNEGSLLALYARTGFLETCHSRSQHPVVRYGVGYGIEEGEEAQSPSIINRKTWGGRKIVNWSFIFLLSNSLLLSSTKPQSGARGKAKKTYQ